MNEKLKCADAIDVTRFVLSLMVVLIHIHASILRNRFGGAQLPILRVAVPIFFLISSFLFFRKFDGQDDHLKLRRFLKRNLLLYAAWFVVLFPLDYPAKQYFSDGFLRGLGEIVYCFLFNSTFFTSWFLSALIIGTLIVYLLSRRLSNRAVLCIGLFIYVLCCLASSYRRLLSDASFIKWLEAVYPSNIVNSFPVSIVWIAMGKCFADRPSDSHLLPKRSLLFPLLGCVLLFIEELLILFLDCDVSRDCYITLLLAVPLLFDWILSSEVRCSFAKKLRKSSVVIFCMHCEVIIQLNAFLLMIGIQPSRLSVSLPFYIAVVAICLICSEILQALSNRFRFFRIFL